MKRIACGLALAASLLAVAPAAAAQEGGGGGIGDAVKQYLESEEGKKALDKSLFDLGFAKTSIGTLKIGGLFDFWYVSQRDPGTASTRSGVETFRIRRAEISLSGSIVKDLVDFVVMFDPARPLGTDENTAPKKTTMQDLKILYKGPFGLPKDMVVTVGQFKIPFGEEGTRSSSKLEFINRADGSGAFSDARRPGVMVQGAPMNGGVEWFLNAHNNNGQNSQDTTADQKNYVGRLVLNPMKFGTADEARARQDRYGTLALGVTREWGYETAAHLDFTRTGADVLWRKSKMATDRDSVFLETEWFRSDDDITLMTDKRSHYYAAGYSINDSWQVVARHDFWKDQVGTTERGTDTFGVNYYIKGHNAKISLDYVRIRQETAAAGRSLIGQIILQFQVAF
jgi:phosphate-selective porin